MPIVSVPKGFLPTNQPDLFFEDNAVGRLKKEVWDASDEQIDSILKEYDIPSPVEWARGDRSVEDGRRR